MKTFIYVLILASALAVGSHIYSAPSPKQAVCGLSPSINAICVLSESLFVWSYQTITGY